VCVHVLFVQAPSIQEVAVIMEEHTSTPSSKYQYYWSSTSQQGH
jgi:hypothetical protein